MVRIFDFLKDAKIFYLATVDGNRPRLRPLGITFMMDDKILFAIGDQKEVYQQMLKNPNVEIVTLAKNGHWLRYSGVAVFEHEKKYVDKVFEMRPSLKRFYNEETNCHIVCFYLTRATCLDVSTFETTKIL